MSRRRRARTNPTTSFRALSRGVRARARRVVVLVLAALAACATLTMALVFALLHNLDRPAIKRRVVALARSAARVDIDYRATRVKLLRGIEIDDLVVRSPPAYRDVAPELARVRKIEAGWSTALFTGAGRRLESVALTDVALAIVIDSNGTTSLDGVGPLDPEPTPAVPLSRRATELVASAPAMPIVDLRGVSLTLVRRSANQAASPPSGEPRSQEHGIERTSLRGLDLRLQADAIDGAWHLRLKVGEPKAPVQLAMTRARGLSAAGDAEAKLWLTADATAREIKTAVELEVMKQSFVEHLDVARGFHAEARARFDPAAHTTSVAIDHTSVANGIVTLDADLEIPDERAPLLHHARGEIDFARLLAILPPELAPIRARSSRGHVHYAIEALALDALPHLQAGSRVAIEGDFADVKIEADDVVPADVDVATAKVSAYVEPGDPAAAASFRARATVSLDGARIGAGRDAVRVDGLTMNVDGTQKNDGHLAGTIGVAFKAIEASGAGALAARDGKLGIGVADLVVDRASPIATRGDFTVTTNLASLDVRSGGHRWSASNLVATAHSQLTGRAPWALEADVRATLLRLFDKAGHRLLEAPMHVAANVVEVFPDETSPRASRGKGSVVVDAGDLHLHVDATKHADAVDFALDSKAPTLEPARPFLPSDVAKRIPLTKMAALLRAKGHIEGLSSTPSMKQHSELRLERPSIDDVVADALALSIDSKGTASHHELDGQLRFEGLALGKTRPSDDRIAFAAKLDRDARALDVQVEASGRAQAKLAVALAFDRSRRAVKYEVEGTFARLSQLAPLASKVKALEGFDLSKVEIALSSRGALGGVVTSIDPDGDVHLEEAPLRTMAVEGTIGLKAHHVVWRSGATSMASPDIGLTAMLRAAGDRRTVETHLDVDEFHLASGRSTLDVRGVSDHSTFTLLGDLAEPELQLEQKLSARLVKQDVWPAYAIGDLTLGLAVRRRPDGIVHVSRFDVANGAGGTSFSLKGAMDPSEVRRRLSLRGDLHQDLSRLSNAPERFAARGTADVALRVESPDLSVFRTVGDVRVEGGDLRLPRSGVSIEGVYGVVPITLALRVGPRGVQLVREERDNPYSSLRFADQHPLLSRSRFISIRKLTLPQVSIAPLVGNMQIEQNMISLRQFEMGVRGGRVTGQCVLDWNGAKSTAAMHVRADGVRSSHGEPFTGSAALAVSAGEHSIEGRADILQIGKRHLLDLLDLQDPFHADAAVNKIRSALWWGYPDRLRVTFDHGFASAHVSFGGLAGLFSVGDLRGIPIGPLVDRLIAPLLPRKDEP